MQIGNTKYAFTLVELIVVVTIIAILATIGFVSYSGYTVNARDSSRISQVTEISNAIHTYGTKNKMPLPDNYVELNAGSRTLSYQWEAGENVLDLIEYNNGGLDPKDGTYFTYTVSRNMLRNELMTFLERPYEESAYIPLTSQNYALDYSARYPYVYGSLIWFVLQETTKIPVNEVETIKTAGEIDLESATSNFLIQLDNQAITGTGWTIEDILEVNQLNKSGPLTYWDVLIIPPETTLFSNLCGDGREWTYFLLDFMSFFTDTGTDPSTYIIMNWMTWVDTEISDYNAWRGPMTWIASTYCDLDIGEEFGIDYDDGFWLIENDGTRLGLIPRPSWN